MKTHLNCRILKKYLIAGFLLGLVQWSLGCTSLAKVSDSSLQYRQPADEESDGDESVKELKEEGLSCPNQIDPSEMQEIARTYPRYAKYVSDVSYCPDDSADGKVLSVFRFIRHIKFPPFDVMQPSRDGLFSKRFAGNWWDFFSKYVKEIEYSPENEICNGTFIGYAMRYPKSGRPTMYICEYTFKKSNLTLLDYSGLFLHEAWHLGPREFPHVKCQEGPRKNWGNACDKSIRDGGAYAVHVETFTQFAGYAMNASPAFIRFARGLALNNTEAFVEPVDIKEKKLLLLVEQNLNKVFLDPLTNQIIKTQSKITSDGQLIPEGPHQVLAISTDTSIDPIYEISPSYTLTDKKLIHNEKRPTSILANHYMLSNRSKFIDGFSGENWSLSFYGRQIFSRCVDGKVEGPELKLYKSKQDLKFDPFSLVYPDGYSEKATTTFVLARDGRVYEVGCNQPQFSVNSVYVNVAKIHFDRLFKQVYRIENKIYGLEDGVLYSLTESTDSSGVRNFTSTPLNLNTEKIMDIAPVLTFDYFSNREELLSDF